jgi:hypothetical protein
MLYEVADIQDIVAMDVLHEVRFQYGKLIPCLAMLIMVMSYLDDFLESDLDRIFHEHHSIYKGCIIHLNSWSILTNLQYMISKTKLFLGKDAAFFWKKEIQKEAVFWASHSINKIRISVMTEMKKMIKCEEFPIEKFKQDMDIAMMKSVKKDQYCFLEMTKLSKMVASRLVSWIRFKLEDIKCAKLCIVGL